MEDIENEPSPILIKFNPEDIPRCPQCNLICSLNLKYNFNEPSIDYLCENNHKGTLLLKDYEYGKFSIFKEKCNDCGKKQKEIKGNIFYCTICQKFICNECQINHSNEEHDIINSKKYDSLCKIHSNTFVSYCINCKRNLCIYCQMNHKNHNIIYLSEIKFSQKSIISLEKEIKEIDNLIKNIDIIKENIINELEKLKKESELEIKFLKILFYTYVYEEEKKNLNYYIIQNLKNFKEKFELKRKEVYENIEIEGKKYIKLIKNLPLMTFQIIKSHTNRINYLYQLSDGRLASCSNDKSLNIYKKDSYEIQLSIKEHSNWIISFTELSDKRIITCSKDNSMKIFKLINEDKYKIEQTLLGHKNGVEKVIEIRINELISISCDKTMKIWKLNNKNIFENISSIIFQKISSDCNILKLNENEFVTSSFKEELLKFWDSNKYSNISTIYSIESYWPYRMMCLLEDDILCVGGMNSKGFYLIKISCHQLIKTITGPKNIFSIYKCFDGLFLCTIIDEKGNNSIVKYKYKNLNLIKFSEIKNEHYGNIISCIELKNKFIASGGDDNLIVLLEESI